MPREIDSLTEARFNVKVLSLEVPDVRMMFVVAAIWHKQNDTLLRVAIRFNQRGGFAERSYDDAVQINEGLTWKDAKDTIKLKLKVYRPAVKTSVRLNLTFKQVPEVVLRGLEGHKDYKNMYDVVHNDVVMLAQMYDDDDDEDGEY